MKTADIAHPLFRAAVEAMDCGDVSALELLLQRNPELLTERLDSPAEGYFRKPYLIWFVADNPIRHGHLPPETPDITRLLVKAVRRNAAESFQDQVDYTLGLVVSGSIPRESGVQLAMMDVLIDAGAVPGIGHGALASGNLEAARHLVARGGVLTLTTALCLDWMDEARRLVKTAGPSDLTTALVAAAFYGMTEKLQYLLASGAEMNAFPDRSCGFHSHATALHQAVSSGSPEAVEFLVNAGASRELRDLVHQGTPLGWAEHMLAEARSEPERKNYERITALLRRP